MPSVVALTRQAQICIPVPDRDGVFIVWKEGNSAVVWAKDAVDGVKLEGVANICTIKTASQPEIFRAPYMKAEGKVPHLIVGAAGLFDISEITDWATLQNTVFIWTKEPNDQGADSVEGTSVPFKSTNQHGDYPLRFVSINTKAAPTKIRAVSRAQVNLRKLHEAQAKAQMMPVEGQQVQQTP